MADVFFAFVLTLDLRRFQDILLADCALLRREILWFTETGVTSKIGAVADRSMERETVADINQTVKAINGFPQVALQESLRRTLEW